jgi:UDP-N-acetylmuramate: L-alanyl-gamma-D-glutamyl-meso-diaminopimelate ligase
MTIHILGICGTFMGGLAALARELGMQVSGSDQHVYPPMSTQLQALGIQLTEGYSASALQPPPQQLLIGNALSRGNPAVEYALQAGLNFESGARWLAQTVLRGRHVYAVAGTHGKTTTSSLLAWLLDAAGENPGFLIGGVPGNFDVSARLGSGAAFVVEADEYDTAFFDKRAKFVHYWPQVTVLNNLEFDHADIYDNVEQIERQFHHLLRCVPGNGRIIVNAADAHLARVLQLGCWTPVEYFGLFDPSTPDAHAWSVELLQADASILRFRRAGVILGEVQWHSLGTHNALNAIAAIAAAADRVDPVQAVQALAQFLAPRRRLEYLGSVRGVHVYDDFAHHPTAIATTIAGLRARIGTATGLHAVLEPRSNSMRQGAHAAALPGSLAQADVVWVLSRPGLNWDAERTLASLGQRLRVVGDSTELLAGLARESRSGDHVLFMSNGGFDGVQQRFLADTENN